MKDEKTQLDKSRKVSVIARAAAVFGVNAVLVYEDGSFPHDRRLLLTILRYLDTPPYLRKRLFPRIGPLKYAGVLHPLKIPSHTVTSDAGRIRKGDVRDGAIFRRGSGRLLDIGIARPLPYSGNHDVGHRVTVLFTSGHPDLAYREIPREQSPGYWGYEVKQRGRLASVLAGWGGPIILTSRRGKVPSAQMLHGCTGPDIQTLAVFGSTDRGLHEILGRKIRGYQSARLLNLFPGQSTATVRLEEAIFGTLSVLNMYHDLYRRGQ